MTKCWARIFRQPHLQDSDETNFVETRRNLFSIDLLLAPEKQVLYAVGRLAEEHFFTFNFIAIFETVLEAALNSLLSLSRFSQGKIYFTQPIFSR